MALVVDLEGLERDWKREMVVLEWEWQLTLVPEMGDCERWGGEMVVLESKMALVLEMGLNGRWGTRSLVRGSSGGRRSGCSSTCKSGGSNCNTTSYTPTCTQSWSIFTWVRFNLAHPRWRVPYADNGSRKFNVIVHGINESADWSFQGWQAGRWNESGVLCVLIVGWFNNPSANQTWEIIMMPAVI